ncbi:ABC transporter ATP-binding protein [Roseovarius indicus]|uniref:ABC transporter ATP-binding protein n=1 Tax=Roseovarius indicus TaxID=540747 RepID=UPI0007DA310E|nr:ABC transporter ATP-binding protein [Roseovarius indicus]OAN98575.1 hypothetical protein A8B76_00545 [Roseovarius indicus]
MTTGAAVKFENVSKHFGNTTALDGLDLTVRSGEFLTLLGESGSGKTTALNLLAGFFQASSGTILVNGTDVSSLPPEKRNIGMVFQNYSLFPHMTVEANIAYPLRMRGEDRDSMRRKTARALEIVHMSQFARRMPSELSGGQQQRVALARAIVFEPPLLLMDEPLGALDQNLREKLQSEIKDLHTQLGCTIVFVTHDQREALALSNRIALMRDGHLEQVGTPTEIYDNPVSEFAARFVGQTNIFRVELRGDQVDIPQLRTTMPKAGADGTATCAVLRPENIRLSPQADDTTISAKLEKSTFQGDSFFYEVRHEDACILVRAERDAGPPPPLGSQVNLRFAREDIVFVRDT